MAVLRKWMRIMFLLIVVPVLLAGIAVSFRYIRFRDCVVSIERSSNAAAGLTNVEVRQDISGHLDYLRQCIARGWLYRKRDLLLGELHAETSQVFAVASGQVEQAHLRPGHHVIVTRSQIDGALLPTSVTVPTGWDTKDPLSLVLILHAGGVTQASDCFPASAFPGVLCAEPLARGSHDYLGVQMTAVEECVADIKRRYPIKAAHVLGVSMGGMGAWLYAIRHVQDVAGVSPWAANADPAAWNGLFRDKGPAQLSPAGRAAFAVRRARAPVARVQQIGSRRDLPIYIGHGTDDTIIPFGHSQSMVRALTAAGASPRFDTFAGRGHKDIPRMLEERIGFLMQPRPQQGPRSVELVIPPLTFVAECENAPPHKVADPLQEARVVISAGRIEKLSNAEAWVGKGPSKSEWPGPAGGIFERPFAMVLPLDAPACLGDCAAEFCEMWSRRFGGNVHRVEAITSLSDETTAVVAIGAPDQNPAVKAALDGTGICVQGNRARLYGRDFSGEDIGLILLRTPVAPGGHPTLVIWGSTPDSYRQLWTRFGQEVDWEGERGRWWFDYAVFDRRTTGADTFIAVGFFDHEWRFDPRLLFEGDPALRANMPGHNWAIARAELSSDADVRLSSLPPALVDSPRGAVGFDRSAGSDSGALNIHGIMHQHGLGMMPPASARWQIGGRYSRFRAVVGLEHVGSELPVPFEAERVRFEIWGDDRLLGRSPEMSAASPPAELTVELKGIAVLELRAVALTAHVWHFGPVGWGSAVLASEKW